MNIAFIHYHLKTGGVTSVLKHQIEALRHDHDLAVLTGEAPASEFPMETITIPGLGYQDAVLPATESEKVSQSIIQALRERFAGKCHILHVHNPTLAKNRSFLSILGRLQESGLTLFLQIHDFSEDGRPGAYFSDEYPADCHYGVINSRDYHLLAQSGLKPQGLHKIDNTVQAIHPQEPADVKRGNHVLYPIRAIRRKNIGEALLLSLFFKNRETLAITLPPNSPADIPSYRGWKDFVKSSRLAVQFEAGLNHDFARLVATSRFLLTTSITEGFGFSYLEPWLAGKPLWGRKLPDICADFEKKNIRLNHLYTGLRVPVDWIGKSELYKKWSACVEKNNRLYQYALPRDRIEQSFDQMTADGRIDFGLLDETFQKTVLTRVMESSKHADRLIGFNPFLEKPGSVENAAELIEHNKNTILEHYNMKSYGNNLLKIYEKIIQTPVRQRIDKKKLLSLFMNLDTYSLLKWGEYRG